MSHVNETITSFVASRLSHLVWGRDYPVHPDVALDCVVKAFIEQGFDVKPHRGREEIEFYYDGFSHLRSYADVLGGWWFHPHGSPASLSKNIEEVCFRLIPHRGKGRDCDTMIGKVRNRYHHHLFATLSRFQEYALMPVTQEKPVLEEPRILSNVLSFYSTSDLAELFFKGDLTESREDRDLFHEQNRFWAGYLQRLSEQKGYDVKYKLTSPHELENNWLAEGTQIFQRGL